MLIFFSFTELNDRTVDTEEENLAAHPHAQSDRKHFSLDSGYGSFVSDNKRVHLKDFQSGSQAKTLAGNVILL